MPPGAGLWRGPTHLARFRKLLAEIFGIGASHDGEIAFVFGSFHGQFDFGGGAIAHADFEAVRGHIEGKVLAHYGATVETDVAGHD